MAILRLSFFASAAALATAATVASAAHAQDTRIALRGPAAASLQAQGIQVSAGRPAKATRGGVALPTTTVKISGRTATVGHGGTLKLASGGRSVTLSGLQVTVGSRSSLSAVVGGRRRTIARITAPDTRRAVDPAGTYVTEAPLTLTSSAVRLLRSSLHKPGLAGGRLGTVDLEASTTAAPSGGDIPGAPAAPTVTGPPTPGAATASTRPAAATSISGGTVTWSPRASWLNYLASSGEAGSVTAQAPATYDGTSRFTLPITSGWFDAATGGALITTAGATNFRWKGHSLDMSFADWTYDLAAATPKAVVKVQRASGSPKSVIGSRQSIGLLKLNGVTPVVSGATVTWTDVPMTLAAEGVSLYRAYLYDSDQGQVTISATLG